MLTVQSANWNSFFFDKNWWQGAWGAARKCARHCIPAAIALALANLTAVFISAYSEAELLNLKNAGLAEITQKAIALCVCLLVLLFALLVSLWALSDWLLKLAAFARTFSQVGPNFHESQLHESIADIRARKMFIGRIWLVASLYLLVPVIPLTFVIAIHVLIGSHNPLLDVSVLSLPSWLTSDSTKLAVLVISFLLTVVTMAYSFVVIVFSGLTSQSAVRTATGALVESFKNAPNLFVVTTLVSVANIVVTAPQVVLSVVGLEQLARNVIVAAVSQIWLAAASLMIWPLSVTPFCQMIKKSEQI